MTEKPFSSSQKQDAGKVPMALIDPYAMQELAHVLKFGATKYSPNGWRKGIEWTRTVSALLRHVYKFLDGETHDPETGLNHMAHVMCNAMFLVNFEKTHPELDDRFNSSVRRAKKTGQAEHQFVDDNESIYCRTCNYELMNGNHA